MFITIHQPEFLPWAGYLDKILQTDHFVVLDSVKYQKNYFLNRCRIKQNGEPCWLTVPVSKGASAERICDKRIGQDPTWAKKGSRAFYYNYAKAPYWSDHEAFFQEVFDAERWTNLADLNIAALEYVCGYLSIPFCYTRSSAMDLQSTGSDLVLEICRKADATSYLSGAFGRDYLKEDEFEVAGISIVYQEYTPPTYEQFNGAYCGPLSIMDMLLNHGRGSAKIIESGRET